MLVLKLYATILAAFFLYALCVGCTEALFERMNARKVGGLYHWRIGRFGGSFYVVKKGRL